MFTKLQPAIRGLILDLDGVLWRDTQPLANLPALFRSIETQGLKVTLATNNATKSIAQYLEKLNGFGVRLDVQQVVNSADAVGFLLQERFPQGGPVFIVGESGLVQSLREKGFFPTDSQRPLAVIAGMDRQISYEKLAQASSWIRQGVWFIGTNPDATFPTPEGLIPGAGSILAALEVAGGQAPLIAGKPAPALFKLAMTRMNTQPEQTLVVGDRLETDIAGGQRAGCRTALVLSGVTSPAQAQAWTPAPDLIAPDITALIVPE